MVCESHSTLIVHTGVGVVHFCGDRCVIVIVLVCMWFVKGMQGSDDP